VFDHFKGFIETNKLGQIICPQEGCNRKVDLAQVKPVVIA
jgi:hypothetical protein